MPLRPLSPFVGRTAELRALRSLLADATAGQARVALVSGEPGVGKSRLVTEALGSGSPEDAADELLTLTGRCHPISGTSLPYAPVVAALRSPLAGATRAGAADPLESWPALRLLAPAAPADGDAPGQPPPSALVLFESVLGFLRSLSEQAPLALVLEDLHWADPSTMDLVSFLACNLAQERLLVVISTRPGVLRAPHPLRQTLIELERLPIVERLDVPPLDRRDLADLVPRLTGRPATDLDLDRLLLRSGGVPFFVEELLHSSGGYGDASATPPSSIRQAIHAELDGLEEDTRRLIAVAAAAGREISVDLLAAATDQTVGAVEVLLRTVIARGLLAPGEEPDTLQFRHDLLREMALADLLPGQRRRLHRRIADVLIERSGPAADDEASAELAYHLDHGGRPREALEATVRAARSARVRSALADVALHLERTLDLWDEVEHAELITATSRRELARQLAECRWLLGDPAAAAHWADVGMRDLQPEQDPDDFWAAAAQRARYLFAAGEAQQAFALLGTADSVTTAPDEAPSPGGVNSLATLASILTLSGDCVGGLAVGERAMAAASRLDMPSAVVHARTTAASARSALGQLEQSVAAFDALVADPPPRTASTASETADEVTNASVAWLRAVNNHAFALNAHGWPRRALAVAERGLAELEHLPLGDTFRATLRGQRAMALLALGETNAARTATEAIPHLPPSRYRLSAPRVALALLSGDLDAATRNLQVSETPADLLSPLPAMAVDLALHRGDPADAARIAARTVEAMTARSLVMFGVTVSALGIRAHLELLDRARATGLEDQAGQAVAGIRTLLGSARDFAARTRGPEDRPAPEAACWLAVAEAWAATALHQRDPSVAVDAWRDACLVTGATDLALVDLRAHLELGRALLVAGRRQDAAEELAAVRTRAQDHGARPLAETVGSIARRGRLHLDGDRHSHATPSLGLTHRELEVLRALADGMTNQEIGDVLFISAKTASVHVSNILRKLDVPNRRAAAARARDLGLLGG